LKPQYGEQLSNFAFNFNLRRYTEVERLLELDDVDAVYMQ